VAYLKPFSFSSKSCILGIGYGFRIIRLFSSRKSDMNLTVPFFLGMMNVGASHSDGLLYVVLQYDRVCRLLYVEFVHVFSGLEMPVHDTR
jgi:hypothetical protein